MFQIDQILIADEVATTQFACNLWACKGACCVVGSGGAPVERSELSVLRKAYTTLKGELLPAAIEAVEKNGLVESDEEGDISLQCVNKGACVFVVYDDKHVATCAIQKAYYEGRFNWEKPISCHLFPIRISKVGETEYINYQYVPAICSAACKKGKKEGIYLSDFVKVPLVRKYGEAWYQKFKKTCEEIRRKAEEV